MSIYTRQRDMSIQNEINVCLIGCGGVGFNAGLILAASGVKKFTLFDPDAIEEHNLNRLFVPYSCIGWNKAKALKEMIKQMRPSADVSVYKTKFDDMFFGASDWIIDCTDSFSAQKAIYEFASEREINYCKLGYDGERISINNKVTTWNIDEDDDEGYNTVPSWAVPSVVVAAMGVAKVLKYHDKEIGTEIKKMFVT